jgi:hypothetical protein
VVGDFDTCGGIAFEVGELAVECGVVEEAGYYVSRIVENDCNVEVLRGLRK